MTMMDTARTMKTVAAINAANLAENFVDVMTTVWMRIKAVSA